MFWRRASEYSSWRVRLPFPRVLTERRRADRRSRLILRTRAMAPISAANATSASSVTSAADTTLCTLAIDDPDAPNWNSCGEIPRGPSKAGSPVPRDTASAARPPPAWSDTGDWEPGEAVVRTGDVTLVVVAVVAVVGKACAGALCDCGFPTEELGVDAPGGVFARNPRGW
jgi:hypothetical protein